MSKAMTAATKEQLVELMQYLSQNISVPTIGIGGGFAPIGTIISYMGTTAPQDYLICDGTTYNIADYKQLSDFFAAQFGSANFFGGDGVTTFKVPDLRGEFLRGSGTNGHSGQGNGADVGVHRNGTEIPIIGAWYTDNTNKVLIYEELKKAYESNTTANSYANADSLINGSGTTRYTYNGDEKTVISYPGSEVADRLTTRPTNTSVLYCIKAVAAGDVYSTTERVVGTWIDGKKVYEKTLEITDFSMIDTSLRSRKWYTIYNNDSETFYDECVIKSGYLLYTESGRKNYCGLNEFLNAESNPECYTITRSSISDTHTLTIFILLSGLMPLRSTEYTNKKVIVTIRYTKTTD